mgnify:FL=1
MVTQPKTVTFCACVAALMAANTAQADGETAAATPRNLKWAYAGEAFESPANWTWAAELAGDVTTGPGAADRVLFTGANVDTTVRLNGDAVVSNFIYEASSKGATTVDLAGHTLTVTNNMSVKSDAKVVDTSALTFKDGAVRVTGSAEGTTTYGQPNENAGGFFLNRAYNDYAGVNLTFDHATLDVVKAPKDSALKVKKSWGTSRIRLLNGSAWNLTSFLLVNDRSCAIEVLAENSALALRGNLSLEGSGSCRLTFRENAALQVGALRSHGRTGAGAAILLDGGEHTLGRTENNGDNGSCSLSWTDVVISNKAVLAATSTLSIRSASSLTVCDGAQLTTPDTLSIGHQAWKTAVYFGDSSLVVDDGMVAVGYLTFGDIELYSNNCLRVVGPLSRVEQTQGKLWGSPSCMAFNYGTQIAFEIPAEGYHDADGVARAPVYTAGAFRSTTTESCRPIGLALATKAFDRANPKKAVTLLQAASDSRAVFEQLMANVTWTDNPNRHGALSVSEDGKSLVYTADLRQGLAVIIR